MHLEGTSTTHATSSKYKSLSTLPGAQKESNIPIRLCITFGEIFVESRAIDEEKTSRSNHLKGKFLDNLETWMSKAFVVAKRLAKKVANITKAPIEWEPMKT